MHHRWRSAIHWNLLLLTAAIVVGASDARGQTPRWELNASGSRITYDSLAALNSPSLGGLLEWRGSSLLGRLTGGVTGFQGAGWTAQGGGDVSGWITPSAGGPLHVELAGAARASRHSSGFDNYLVRGDARLHWITPGAGAWAGLGAARSRNTSDASAANALVPNVGGWARLGAGRLTVGYQAPEIFDQRFHEASSALSLSSDRVDVTAFAGWRTAAGTSTIPNEAWGGATATLWFNPMAALLVSGGRYGPDVLQGLPGGTFVSLGLRLTSRRVRPVPESAARAPLFFGTESADAGTIGFRVLGARSVEVAGDWNDWTPEPLRQDAEGRWTLPAGLSPGIYRFNLRVDGMRWIVPAGVPVADDGFGGEVGILIVRDEP